MARKRMIDPSFWTDEKLGTIEPRARLLFMGLISQADDDGRLNGHPALIKSLIFPYDYDIQLNEVEEWITELFKRNLIIRYEVSEQKYIAITNFRKHQTINRPQASKLPEPPNEDTFTDHTPFSESSVNDHAQRKGKEGKGKEIEMNISEGKVTEEGLLIPPDLDSIKDSILKLINKNELKDLNINALDNIYSFIGVVDIEVIQTAINKSTKKHINYAVNTLKRMVSEEGITKKEQVTQKTIVGNPPNNVTNFKRGNGSIKPSIPTVQNDSVSSQPISEQELEELRALAQKFDNQKEDVM